MQLYNANCLDVLPTIEDKSIDFICCDLLYGTTASNWDKALPMDKLWAEYKRILKPNGVVALFASGMFVPRVMLSNLEWYKYTWIWVKRGAGNFVHAKNRPMTKHEQILIFSPASMGHKSQLGDKRMTYNPQGLVECGKIRKDNGNRFGTMAGKRPSHKAETVQEYTNYPLDVLMDFPELSPQEKLHTNEKPIPLLEYLIRTYSHEGETVLDNCCGSGSCCLAAKKCGRQFIGIELDEKYFNVAKRRIEIS